ncbi:uncharacterized protein ARB_02841 [Trichophyton benhamiae CBS 112371]|uniref:Uncharacterized protein n=1 Tax=Arthroderma benhamiae (strain ATCC MYA-4681 / CBS 112371) TaxID=663331 RepID=D4B307_ARTBC|nr:uncharacterized protein ARB_02841 [Trichophyton benhamiae CBS 112371]EFE30303.1 conserved hypothetical protein [Trichophyton benhamiae CBS 112371]
MSSLLLIIDCLLHLLVPTSPFHCHIYISTSASASPPERPESWLKAVQLGSGTNIDSHTPTPRGGVRLNKIAESWEDEDLSSEDEASDAETTITAPPAEPSTHQHHHQQGEHHHQHQVSRSGIRAPPPTPNVSRQSSCRSTTSSASCTSSGYSKRPEKQIAVATRMIGNALGHRVARSDSQKEYDRTVIANEKKRREKEKLAEEQKREEEEKAKAAIWDE